MIQKKKTFDYIDMVKTDVWLGMDKVPIFLPDESVIDERILEEIDKRNFEEKKHTAKTWSDEEICDLYYKVYY